MTASRNVTVRVLDAGSDVPRFSRCVYEISLRENNRAGARLLRVAAADRDARRNATVRYSLDDDANGEARGLRRTCCLLVTTSGSAITEGPRDVLVSRNSATTKYPYRVALFA